MVKISEIGTVKKEFDLQMTDGSGKSLGTGKLVMCELPFKEQISIERQCYEGKGEDRQLDMGKTSLKMLTHMIAEAPFETDDNITWKDMQERQREEVINALPPRYISQLTRFVKEMGVRIGEAEKNLS